MADDSAASRTFGAVELLEMVLVNFDIKDLFKLKRVCRQWNEVITTSKKIRQICFLEPAVPTRMAVGHFKDFDNQSGVEIVPSAKTQVSEKCCLTVVQQHPAFKPSNPDLGDIESGGKEFGTYYTFYDKDIQELRRQDSVLDNMLVTQPPFYAMSVSVNDGEWHRLREGNGFTFGKLRKAVLDEWGNRHGSYSYVYLDIPGTLLDSLIPVFRNQTDTPQ